MQPHVNEWLCAQPPPEEQLAIDYPLDPSSPVKNHPAHIMADGDNKPNQKRNQHIPALE